MIRLRREISLIQRSLDILHVWTCGAPSEIEKRNVRFGGGNLEGRIFILSCKRKSELSLQRF